MDETRDDQSDWPRGRFRASVRKLADSRAVVREWISTELRSRLSVTIDVESSAALVVAYAVVGYAIARAIGVGYA